MSKSVAVGGVMCCRRCLEDYPAEVGMGNSVRVACSLRFRKYHRVFQGGNRFLLTSSPFRHFNQLLSIDELDASFVCQCPGCLGKDAVGDQEGNRSETPSSVFDLSNH